MKTINCLAIAIGLAIASQNANATFLRGQPYTPAGANFSMTAVQGINPANQTGTSGFHPQVNGDFEFKNSIGVSWDDGTGKLKDFGLGLYQDNAHNTFSTGLNITYNTLVQASSITITVEDFDIQAGHDTAFKPNKVEPGILIFGPGGSIFANLTPAQIFPYLKLNNNAGGAKDDTWDINFGDVLSGLKIADGPVSGFLLYADMLNGEQANSDPYLLVAIGNGIPVPEPGTWMAIIAVALMLGGSHLTVLRRNRATA